MRFYVKLVTGSYLVQILGQATPRILWRFNLWAVYDADKQRYTHHKSTYYNACKYRDYYEDLYR